MLKEYDPNISRAKQTVEVTFMQWDNRATRTAVVGGNCLGFGILESAVEDIYNKLPLLNEQDGGECPYIILVADDGQELECVDECQRGHDWLKEMVVKVEIISRENHSSRESDNQ